MSAVGPGSRYCVRALVLVTLSLALLVPANAGRVYGVEPGARSAAHQEVIACESCHESQKQIPARKCMACHPQIRRFLDQGAGLHARFTLQGITCVRCHREHRGADFDISGWSAVGGAERFSHASTGYELRGYHVEAAKHCKSCHPGSPRHFEPLSTGCGAPSCHGASDPHGGTLGTQCQNCHTEMKRFPDTLFEHNDPQFSSRWRLVGKHAAVPCRACHPKAAGARAPVFHPVPTSCRGCHHNSQASHRRRSQECEKCHDPSGWT